MTKPHNNSSRSIKYCFSLYLSLVIFLGLFLQANAETEFKIITLQHRFAEEILPAIKPLVGDEGTATAMQNNLIIRTSRNNMAEIEQLISSLDTVRQNLKITIRRNTNNDIGLSRTEITGRSRNGNATVEIGGRGINKQNGLALDIENYQSKSNVSNEQFIRVADGEQAFILVGQSVPYTQDWISLSNRYSGIRHSTTFVNIDTGFAVRPRMSGNQVEVEITPRFSQFNRHSFIDFTTLSTIVRINRDEWLNIADTMHQNDEISRAILSRQMNNKSMSDQLLIRVE